MRRTLAAARSRGREWWPELLTGVLLIAIAMAGQKDDPLFAIFCAIIGAIFWAMGIRHRRLPLHAKLDKVGQDVTEVRDILLGDDAGQDEDEPGRPRLTVV